ncbi:DUF1878 domain-containing protein [Bacillus sp. ISL-53]|nr:DUF1878 domain-containing protein [Bacillus sp. ISL-53]
MNPELLERLDFIEFRQQLLFDNDELSRLLFEHEVTREQYGNILNLFDSLREQADNNETLSSSGYESSIYRIVPQQDHNYHFAESVAQTLHTAGRYEEVFEGLYKDSPKFQSYFERHNS